MKTMLLIRKQQIEVFEEARSPEFDDYMVAHLKDFTPLHLASLGEVGIRKLINVGMERAKKFGFTCRGPVKFYIETMILLGLDFDTDPQYPWAGNILRDASLPDQTERADRLHAWLMGLLDAAAGPTRECAKAALIRARKIPLDPVPVSSANFEDEIIRRMKENHPEKVNYLGETTLRDLIPRAIDEAKKYSVFTDAGVCLFIGLMFAVGHGFARDPKYPWIENTLTNPAITDPHRRVERLYSKTMTYLDHVLQHLKTQ
jgi:hypothetical protein